MLVVSDSVTALLPIFSTNVEGVGGSFVPIYSTISYTLGVTIQLWWVGDRQTVLSTVPTQQHGDDDDDLIGGTSIAII